MARVAGTPVVLFGPASLSPRKIWNASDFTTIDDRVRGGSSKSFVKVDPPSGSLMFQGFLDTLTLGGAGFASQSYMDRFPGDAIERDEYLGLRIVAAEKASSSNSAASSSSSSSSPVEGGGKAHVETYTLNLKTTPAKQRPDGRRESTIVYEFDFTMPSSLDKLAAGRRLSFDAPWDAFKPTYRGKPAEDAPPLKTENILEWSIMARSNFGVSVLSCARPSFDWLFPLDRHLD